MSLFRKPKKPIQRRVFSGYDDEEDIENNDGSSSGRSGKDKEEKMDVDDQCEGRSTTSSGSGSRDKKKDKKKEKDKFQPQTKTSLLSFDDEEEGEVFQVKKSSHSKKVMKRLDKERKKKHKIGGAGGTSGSGGDANGSNYDDGCGSSSSTTTTTATIGLSENSFKDFHSISESKNKLNKRNKSENSNSIQTEIRTDDFVLVVKKSEPDKVILNGRAALCAGRDDMSSDDEYEKGTDKDDSKNPSSHKFSTPDNFKKVLESGAIPDAAMIHAARKRRQKARELGEFIPVEEPVPDKKGGNRLIRDDGEDDGSDEEERVDMSAITGVKEREERREKFYSAQQEYSGDESDLEMNEWENQQIRKGVTGAQLVSAQQESVYSQFMIQSNTNTVDPDTNLSTGALLEQAYARSLLEKPRQIILSTQHQENKPSGPRMPAEVLQKVADRLSQLKEIHNKHYTEIERLSRELDMLQLEKLDCDQKAPLAAGKYRFYQELRGYITDLIECFDEKVPIISDLEKKTIELMGKRSTFLVERRRQDVRDQAKEMADATKTGGVRKGGPEDNEHIRRAAEREGRRTRRRRDRERNEQSESHLDGMSSDDEVPDQDTATFKSQMEQILAESADVFHDASDEFSQLILNKIESWKRFDIDSYKEAYVTLCLPKIIGPLIRLKLIAWSPLDETGQDIDKMFWYNVIMNYGYVPGETEITLADDPDVRFVPITIEKILLPKITEHIDNCWDPLSTTQTLRLVGLIGRLGRDYPTLRPTSKPLRTLFTSILDKMKLALENDVFIPIFPKHMQEAKGSFFQRQFCSGLKLFRNFLSWQGIISDLALKDIAISSLLNRYLLSAMRVCTPPDAIAKANIIVNTLPRVWLHPESSILKNMEMLLIFLRHIANNQLDKKNPAYTDYIEKITKILSRLHANL